MKIIKKENGHKIEIELLIQDGFTKENKVTKFSILITNKKISMQSINNIVFTENIDKIIDGLVMANCIMKGEIEI